MSGIDFNVEIKLCILFYYINGLFIYLFIVIIINTCYYYYENLILCIIL